MLRDGIRSFGLLVGGICLFAGGGMTVVYGLLFVYTASPGGPSVREVLWPINEIVRSVAGNPVVVLAVAVGLGIFVVDVAQHGLLNTDDRILAEKKKDWRRQKARESDAWDPPPEDRESPSVYDELMEQVGSKDLVIERDGGDLSGDPSVRGAVRNTSAQPYRNVSVEVRFLDRDGQVVATQHPTTKRLNPATSWEFEVFYTADGPVAGYDISTPRGEAESAVG